MDLPSAKSRCRRGRVYFLRPARQPARSGAGTSVCTRRRRQSPAVRRKKEVRKTRVRRPSLSRDTELFWRNATVRCGKTINGGFFFRARPAAAGAIKLTRNGFYHTAVVNLVQLFLKQFMSPDDVSHKRLVQKIASPSGHECNKHG